MTVPALFNQDQCYLIPIYGSEIKFAAVDGLTSVMQVTYQDASHGLYSPVGLNTLNQIVTAPDPEAYTLAIIAQTTKVG